MSPFFPSPLVRRSFLIAFLFVLLASQSSFAISNEDIQTALVEALGYSPSEPFSIEDRGFNPDVTDPLIANVYRENGFEPLWVTVQGPNPNAEIIFEVLNAAPEEGLNPEDYDIGSIETSWHATTASGIARLDILLTQALEAYVSDAREGRLDPCIKDPDLFACARDRNIDPVDLTTRAMAAPDLRKFLVSQVPDTTHYRDLRDILKKYREIEERGGWPVVPEGASLKPATHDPRIPQVRQRLIVTQDLELDDPPADLYLYDAPLVAAVKKFQDRHGLTVDGVIGEATRSAMNISVASKIRRIVVNMERLRWIYRDLGSFHVLVNIAGFRLSVFDNTRLALEMPVIVGKHYRATPVFSDHIKYIEFNPYWNIPPTIASEDILPKLKENPAYLTAQRIRLFDGWKTDARELQPVDIPWVNITPGQMASYKLRQEPGPKNQLGRLKFMFPNRFSVYMHDTPAQNLFHRAERTFSSGCIRLSRPVELASYLLGGEEKEWGINRIRNIIDSGDRKIVSLEKPVSIHIIYLTVCVGPNGAINFNKDVYGRDALLEKALFDNGSGE